MCALESNETCLSLYSLRVFFSQALVRLHKFLQTGEPESSEDRRTPQKGCDWFRSDVLLLNPSPQANPPSVLTPVLEQKCASLRQLSTHTFSVPRTASRPPIPQIGRAHV